MIKKKGFTLMELLAVIIILAIILSIAIPTLMNIINNQTRNAFESDAKMVIRTINYRVLEDESLDIMTLKKDATDDTVSGILNISTENYETISLLQDEQGTISISIVGKNRWDGLVAYGTYFNMNVISQNEYTGGYYCATFLGEATPNEVLLDKTFTNNDGEQIGIMPNRIGNVTANNMTRSGTTLRFRPLEGYYSGNEGNSVQFSDVNFLASNIKSGVSLFGVTGTHQGKRVLSGTTAFLNPGDSVNINVGFASQFIKTELNRSHNNSVVAWHDDFYNLIRIGSANFGTYYITPQISYTVGATSFTITTNSNASNGSTVTWVAHEF